MAGALMQLVAYGAQDAYLTGDPQITFFKVVYRRHTNFAIESMEQTLEGDAAFGSTVSCKIARNGDLLGATYVEMKLGGGSNLCNRVGFAMLREVDLVIGGTVIDRHTGVWMNVWTELTHSNDKKRLLDCMVGDSTQRRINLNQKDGSQTTINGAVNNASLTVDNVATVNVPLQFSFCRNPGLALPLVALQYHEVELNLKLASNVTDVAKRTDVVTNIAINSMTMYSDYIFLDTDERKKFAQNPHEYLIETVQHIEGSLAGTGQNSIRLNFNHPVKELVWVGRHTTNTSANGDNFSNYSSGGAGNAATQVNSLAKGLLRLNGQNRFSARDGRYFNETVPYQHHTGCPAVGVNCYSFALKPEEHQPSGTCNFSRIDNAELVVNPAVATVTKINVFAHGYNVLRVASGMGGTAYSN